MTCLLLEDTRTRAHPMEAQYSNGHILSRILPHSRIKHQFALTISYGRLSDDRVESA